MSGCRFTITKEIARKIVAIRKAEGSFFELKGRPLVGETASYTGDMLGWESGVNPNDALMLFDDPGSDDKFTQWLKANYPEFFL